MNRKLAALCLAVSAIFLAGCSTHSRFGHDPALVYYADHRVEPPLQPGFYGGNLSTVNAGDPKTFNQWVAEDQTSADVSGILYDCLETLDSYTLKFESRLAYMPKISNNGLVFTYTLKPGIKWSDGVPITADDVIFTLDVLNDPNIETLYKEGMLVAVHLPNGKTKLEPFKYKKIDERTVQFTLPEKWAPAEEMFGFLIMPKHSLEKIYRDGQFNSAWGIDTPPSELVSSGPYVMAKYVANQRVVFKRNPYFWRYGAKGQHLPYLDTFTWGIVPDLNSALLNFRAGGSDEIDIQTRQYPSVARYAQRDNYTVVDTGPTYSTGFCSFNENPRSTMKNAPQLLELFQNKTFRQACSYAVDRQTMCNNIDLGLAVPLYGPETAANLNFYDPHIHTYPYNPQLAKQMLLGIGLTPGANGMLEYKGAPVKFSILTSVESPSGVAMTTILMNDWRNIGLDVAMAPVTFNNLDTKVSAAPYDWQAVVMGFGGGPEPNDGADLWRPASSVHLWYPKENPTATDWEKRIDDDFTQGAEQTTLAGRKKYYNDWQEVVADEQPMIYLVNPHAFIAMRNHYGNVKPVASSGGAGAILWNMEELYDTHVSRLRPF